MPNIRALTVDDLVQVQTLAEASEREGFRFVRRFAVKMPVTALDTRAQWFLGVFDGDELRAIGGITPDPYLRETHVGRVRRVYVEAALRGRGYGRQLLDALETRARQVYSILRLSTDTPAAAAFYEHRGYARLIDEHATHILIGSRVFESAI